MMTSSNLTTASGTTTPRLEPIEKPNSLKLKFAYWYLKRKMGKVLTPVKVNYARFPEAFGLGQKIIQTEKKTTIPTRLKHFIKVYIASLNGCAFCVDIGKASAIKSNLDSRAFNELLQFESSNQFSAAEKAALKFVDETTRNKHVVDETFAQMQKHFSEKEIVEITLLNAIENFYNLMNGPMNIGSDELCEIWGQQK